MKKLFLFILSALIMTCTTENLATMDSIAEKYVKLVLELGLYDGDVVDAYYGPEEWRPAPESKAETFPAEKLLKHTKNLLSELEKISTGSFSEIEHLRHRYLNKQLIAVQAKIQMINGTRFNFNEEAQLLYDADVPTFSEAHFAKLIQKLDDALPGKGDIAQRYQQFRDQFKIPVDKLSAVFDAAIAEGRKRTLEHISLPEHESFTVEMVKNVPWGAYNWYKGNSFSLIQVNTDRPSHIDAAVNLASHEGYPGHHVYNTLLENRLYKKRGWVEFSIYNLFSPQSLIAEGTANFGIKMAFPGESRVQFEKEVLFPLAGLDPDMAEKYYQVLSLAHKLSFASNEANRRYLDGEISKEERENWLVKYALYSPERAKASVAFVEKYRTYVINYNYGQYLVEKYIEKNGGTADHPQKRWEIFEKLISTPQVPSNLK